MRDIFIAYPSEDKKTAKTLTQKLEQAGYSCKIFPRDLSDRAKYDEELEQTLENCSMFVILYSDFAEKSQQLSKQMTLAWDYGLKIVPFRTGKIGKSLSADFLLHQYEWVDAYGDGFNTAYEILLEIIQEVNEGKTPEEQIGRKVKSKPENRKTAAKSSPNLYYIIGAAVVLLFVVLYAGGVFDSENSELPNQAQNASVNVQPGQVDLTDRGDINSLTPEEQMLVGEWVVSDYSDNQNLPAAEKQANHDAIVGNGRLVFNADKRFFRIGFTQQVQTAEWEFDLQRKVINILIDGRKEPINLAQFSDSTFTLLTTERTTDPNTGMQQSVTTRIVFTKKE